MSENLDLVRSIYARWERGDFTSADWADPEIEFTMVGGVAPGQWKGAAEMARVWAETLSAWDGLRAIPEGFREIDDDRVLVLLHNQGRGKGSGIQVSEISARSANVFTVRDGRVTKLALYWDRSRAIADLGLVDQPAP